MVLYFVDSIVSYKVLLRSTSSCCQAIDLTVVTAFNMTFPSSNTSSSAATAYQVECQMTKKGKMFAGSKRRVCWRFGFASRDALEAGEAGTACRGEEHEVVMVWSLTSGKQFVLADGHEVHWSKSRKIFDKFECEWQMASGRKLSVVAHASTPLFDKKESFRQFDLKINGVSFWDLPQMYELGGGAKSSYTKPQSSPLSSTPKLRQVSPLHDGDSMDDQYSVVSDIHASFYRSQPQLSALDAGLSPPRTISPSPSMPDFLDFSSPAPSSMNMLSPMHHSISNSQGLSHSQTPSRPQENLSPTSVVMNPFDVYALPSADTRKSSQGQQLYPHPQQSPFHASNGLNRYALSIQSPMATDPWSAQQQRQQYFQHQQMQQQPFSPGTSSHTYATQTSVYAGY
jgi:hypothetical protein